MQQPSNKIIGITVLAILLAFYSLRNTPTIQIDDDEDISISLCQIQMEFQGFNTFDDRTLLSLLSTLKMHDFQIGQPVWAPSDILIYLCEHRLKTGLKQSIIDKELRNVIRNHGATSKRFAWSCA